jgi:predicted nucleotidyltransferase
MADRPSGEFKESAVAYRTERPFPALLDASRPVSRAANRLEPYLRAIVDEIHPEKIVLFGSYAYGEPRWDSDFDLLVVRSNITSEKASVMEIFRSLRKVEGVPPSFTILSKTPEFISRRLAEGSPLYREILEKGLELYAT